MIITNRFVFKGISGLRSLIIQFFILSIYIIFFEVYINQNVVLAEEIAVVVNLKNPVQKLTLQQVSDIFLARRKVFPSSGVAIFVIDYPQDSSIRETFFSLMNMRIKQVNAYWARLRFSGDVLSSLR